MVFQFEDIGPLKPYSADTWISVKNWTNIYEQLDDFVNDPKDISNNSQLAFELHETPFTCSVSWSDISEPLGVAVCLFLSHCDKKKGKYKLPGFISIHVTNSISSKIFTEIASLRKEISTLKYELKKSKSSSSSSRSGGGGGCKTRSQSSRTRSHKPEQASKKPLSNAANSDGTQYTIEKADADHEEYVPNAVRRDNTLLEAGIKYEPGKVAESSKGQSHVVIANAEKYVPPQVSPVLSGKPKYIPSSASSSKSEPPPGRSSTRSGHPKIPNDHHKKTDARRNNGPKESNRKRGHSPDLFGTDDESSATQRCQDAAKPSHRVMPKREVPPTKAHRDPSNDRKKRTVLQSSNSQPKMNTIKPSNAVVDTTRPKLMSSEELKKFMDTRDEAISEMNKLSEMMRPEVLPDVEVVTLKHIRPDDLEKMFEEHRLDLKLMFDNYRKQTVGNIFAFYFLLFYNCFVFGSTRTILSRNPKTCPHSALTICSTINSKLK